MTLKAACPADMPRMLILPGPDNPMRRPPYQTQADDSWRTLKDPQNKGGDDNVPYEYKGSSLWPVGTLREFETQTRKLPERQV